MPEGAVPFVSSRTCRRIAVTAVALFLLLSVWATPAMAATGSVELEAALDDDTDSTAMQFSFVASQNGTVTLGADESVQQAGGDVEFAFRGWSGNGADGTDSTWDVVAGEQYVVEYTASARSGASEASYDTTVDIEYQDGTYETGEQLTLAVTVLEPAFGSVSTPSGEVIFVGGSTAKTTVTADIPNTGDGLMVIQDVSFSGVPSGVSPEADSVPDRIDSSADEPLDIDVTVDESVSEGTYYFDATVTDNRGNSQTFTVGVDVSKPPVVSVDEPVEAGDVLVGRSKTISFEVSEVGGYEGLNGLDAEVVSGDPQGSLSISTSSRFRTSSGGSDEAEVTISADGSARQHTELDFDVIVSGDAPDSPERRISFTARVIYPAKLGQLRSSPDDFEFDEPREQVSEQRMRTTVSIPNEGDLDMNVVSVSASADNPSLSAQVAEAPATVEGIDSETATIEITADPDTPEGSYALAIRVETADAGSETITEEITVVHETEMSVEETDVTFGEVTITDQLSRSIDVGERLGYNDLQNLEITVVEGPDQWLSTTAAPPSTLEAGGSSPLVFGLKFDTNAEAYQEYVWRIRVNADNVEPATITVSATPRLLSAEDITQDLETESDDSAWEREVKTSTSDGLLSLEQQLRNGGNVTGADLRRSLTIAQSTVILLESVDAVEQQQAEGNYGAAQSRVVSALITRNLIVEYVAELENDRVASDFEVLVDGTAEPVDEIVTEQEQQYESTLADTDTTALNRYRAASGLAALSAHQGDERQAETYEQAAEEQFEEYQTGVNRGINRRQTVRNSRTELQENATLVFLGQPIIANPARIDEIRRVSADAEGDYATAEKSFREAGATNEADATEAEAAAATRELLITRVVLYGISGVLSIVFTLLMAREVLNARTYVLEAREAATGDFLL